MSKIRNRGEEIRKFIIANVDQNPRNLADFTGKKFEISRQAVHKHLKKLVDEKALVSEGNTRQKSYRLAALTEATENFKIDKDLAEDVVWRSTIAPRLGVMPDNVLSIWSYGFTEMFNNAIDHSEGSNIHLKITKTAVSTEIQISDNGVGIFKKIQANLHLLDERQAILELAKGKLTTDPKNHTGEGIFFSSRMFDEFAILSGGVYFSHSPDTQEDWILEREKNSTGTNVYMQLKNHTSRTTKKIFRQFQSGGSYGFNKTVVPVKLAKYGNENLESRSQAKRLLSRVDRFKTVIFDFSGVDSVGQAFADEIFRVFATNHPVIKLMVINAAKDVKEMISRAKNVS